MKKFAYLIPFLLPAVAFAQIRDVFDVGAFFIDLINNLAVPVLFALAFIMFIWGVYEAFIATDEKGEKRKEGRKKILWGLIAFFIMVSVWGLVNIFVNSVNLNNAPPRYPSSPEIR
jgi:hypothetical protein